MTSAAWKRSPRVTLKPLLAPDMAALKKRLAVEQTEDPKRPPYVSMLEAWWINQQAGSYVEIVEWRKTSDGTMSVDSKTHRSCIAEGISDSREDFVEQARLDAAADYAVRTDRETTIVETSDGASPELSVRFVKDGVRRPARPDVAPSKDNVSLSAGLTRVSQTVGWPARWSFSASSELN